MLRVLQILELMPPQVAKAGIALGQAELNQLVRGLREEDLAPMAGCADARRSVNIEADVASAAEGSLSSFRERGERDFL